MSEGTDDDFPDQKFIDPSSLLGLWKLIFYTNYSLIFTKCFIKNSPWNVNITMKRYFLVCFLFFFLFLGNFEGLSVKEKLSMKNRFFYKKVNDPLFLTLFIRYFMWLNKHNFSHMMFLLWLNLFLYVRCHDVLHDE